MARAAVEVLVHGAGAIGQYLGGRLAAAGCRVHFVGRAPVVDALRRDGLVITELDGRVTTVAPQALSAATDLASTPAPGLVLLTVKSGATASAGAELAAALPAGTPVISFQNGIENAERLAAAAPGLVAIAGMVPYNVVQSAPGRVQRTTDGRLAVADHPLLRAWAPCFAAAGLALDRVPDIRAVQWGKLLLNLNNPVNAIVGVPLLQQLLDRDCRVVLAALQEEALRVLAVAGIAPAQVGALPPRWIPRLLRLPTPLFRRIAARLLTISPAARSSMYDDRVAGRPTEVDALCGAVVRLARRHGLEAPRNARVAELVAGLAAGEYWSGQTLRARLGA